MPPREWPAHFIPPFVSPTVLGHGFLPRSQQLPDRSITLAILLPRVRNRQVARSLRRPASLAAATLDRPAPFTARRALVPFLRDRPHRYSACELDPSLPGGTMSSSRSPLRFVALCALSA